MEAGDALAAARGFFHRGGKMLDTVQPVRTPVPNPRTPLVNNA